MAEAGPGDGVAGGGPGMTAWRLGARFVEGDAHHPPANVAKMARGEPLDDADRAPWLAALACSALEADYRHILAAGGEVVFVHLTGAEGLIAERLAARRDHDMPPSLLASQLRTLQPLGPNEPAITVSIAAPPEAIAEEIERRLKESRAGYSIVGYVT